MSSSLVLSTRLGYLLIAVAAPDGSGVAPGRPTGLSASATSATTVDLAWTLNGAAATSVSVERSPDGSTGWSAVSALGGTAAAFGDTGLAPSTTYYYRVR